MTDSTPFQLLSTFTLADPATFHAVAAVALIMTGTFSLTAFLTRRHISLRGVMALHLLNMLVVLFSLFVLFQPRGILYGGVAMALLIGLIRALSKFENTDKS